MQIDISPCFGLLMYASDVGLKFCLFVYQCWIALVVFFLSIFVFLLNCNYEHIGKAKKETNHYSAIFQSKRSFNLSTTHIISKPEITSLWKSITTRVIFTCKCLISLNLNSPDQLLSLLVYLKDEWSCLHKVVLLSMGGALLPFPLNYYYHLQMPVYIGASWVLFRLWQFFFW